MRLLCVTTLLLVFAGVSRGQDEGSGDAAAPPAAPAAAADGAAAKAGADGAAAKAGTNGTAADECEESWEYIAFLRGEVK
jgi:hypothetical protein